MTTDGRFENGASNYPMAAYLQVVSMFVCLACLLAPPFFAAPSESSPGVVANGQCLAN